MSYSPPPDDRLSPLEALAERLETSPLDLDAWGELIDDDTPEDATDCELWAQFLLHLNYQEYAELPEPGQPTTEWPGTIAKQDVMEKRAERGESLFHPGDARTLPNHLAFQMGARLANGREDRSQERDVTDERQVTDTRSAS